MSKLPKRVTLFFVNQLLQESKPNTIRFDSLTDITFEFKSKDSAEFPHFLGGGMNTVQALACWLMKPLHYSPLLVLYTA